MDNATQSSIQEFKQSFIHYVTEHANKFSGGPEDPQLVKQLEKVIKWHCGITSACKGCKRRFGCKKYVQLAQQPGGRNLLYVSSDAAVAAQCKSVLTYAAVAASLGNDQIANQALLFTTCDPNWARAVRNKVLSYGGLMSSCNPTPMFKLYLLLGP